MEIYCFKSKTSLPAQGLGNIPSSTCWCDTAGHCEGNCFMIQVAFFYNLDASEAASSTPKAIQVRDCAKFSQPCFVNHLLRRARNAKKQENMLRKTHSPKIQRRKMSCSYFSGCMLT